MVILPVNFWLDEISLSSIAYKSNTEVYRKSFCTHSSKRERDPSGSQPQECHFLRHSIQPCSTWPRDRGEGSQNGELSDALARSGACQQQISMVQFPESVFAVASPDP